MRSVQSVCTYIVLFHISSTKKILFGKKKKCIQLISVDNKLGLLSLSAINLLKFMLFTIYHFIY